MFAQPQLHLIPLRSSIPFHQASTLDVLVQVVPPDLQALLVNNAQEPRFPLVTDLATDSPPDYLHHRLNLSLVIDRSSSMASRQRLVFAKAAARHIVQALSPRDRVSIVAFDRQAQVLVPSTFVEDPVSIIQTIQAIEVGKWTNLHGGWVEGADQVNRHIYANTVNRVILLTDGWVSSGVINRATITAHVQEMAQAGISTTAVGVGDRYNEDLLEAIATQGDGNYYYIHTPSDLPKAFEREMQALVATVGQQVTLDIQPHGDVEIEDVLNDLDVTRQGRFKLPNLVSGFPFNVVVRFHIPAISPNNAADVADVAGEDMDDVDDGNSLGAYSRNWDNSPTYQSRVDTLARLCRFHLRWHPLGESRSTSQPASLKTTLALPLRSPQQLENASPNPEVQQQVALMLTARLKRQAMALADRKDYDAAQAKLQDAKRLILDAPQSQWLELEIIALESLETALRSRQLHQFRKRSHNESYQTTSGFDQQSGIFGYGD